MTTSIIASRNASRRQHMSDLFCAVRSNSEDVETLAKVLTIQASGPRDHGFSRSDLEFYDGRYAAKEEQIDSELSEISAKIGRINARITGKGGVGVSPRDIDARKRQYFLLRSIKAKKEVFTKMRALIRAEMLRRQGGTFTAEKTPV